MANLKIPPRKIEGTNFRKSPLDVFWFLVMSVVASVVLGICAGLMVWVVLFYGMVPE